MSEQDRQEIEEGRQQFVSALPKIIGVALIASWIITSLAKHFLQ
jgi:hypothetical protein